MDTLTKDMQKVLNNYPEEMDKMLQQPTRRYVKNARAILRTPADIYDHPTFYSFVLDMPGIEVNNIKVRVENGLLHVAGKRKKKKPADYAAMEKEGIKVIRMERKRPRFMRKFSLPPDANQEAVKATYRDGVLTLVVAKKPREENEKPKTISVPIS